MTGKQRAVLRKQANTLKPVVFIGKNGITDEVVSSADVILEANELIKCSVLEAAGLEAREAADAISGKTSSEVISVVGRKFVLYRKSSKEDKRKYSLMI